MPRGEVTDELIEFHRRVARGGVAMTTVAYCAVSPGGRVQRHTLVMDDDIVPDLRKLTDAVHDDGAMVSAQLGHAGLVANTRSNRQPTLAPSTRLQRAGHGPRARCDGRAARRGRRRLRARDDCRGRRRLRRDRSPPRSQLSAQLVLQPQLEPPHRRVRRQHREPRPARPASHGSSAQRSRARHRGDREVQHGRRCRGWSLARREHRDREAARSRRSPRRARAHRRQLVAQRDVLLPWRRADEGVHRVATEGCRLGLPHVRQADLPDLPVRRSVLPAAGAPVPRGTVDAADPARAASTAATRSTARVAEGFDAVAMARALLREPDLVNQMRDHDRAEGLCIHCNKCLPTIYSGTRCVLVPAT